MLLLLAVLLEDAQRSTAGCAHKIRVRPRGWQFPFEHRKFLAQQTRRTPFDQFHQPMNAKLGIDTHQQVTMIGHDFQFLDLCLMFLANLPDDFLQASFDGLHQNLPPLFRTPDHMVVASVEYVPVAFVGLDHMFQYTAACYLLSRADVLEGAFHFFAPRREVVNYRKKLGERDESMKAKKNKRQRSEQMQQVSAGLRDVLGMTQWRKEHPHATWAEIEAAVDEQINQLRAQLIQELVQLGETEEWSQKPEAERPRCATCGKPLLARGEQTRFIQTTGGEAVKLTRAYGTCPACGVGFFPPG